MVRVPPLPFGRDARHDRLMRKLSGRRMRRWLERKTAAARRGRRYGLCAMEVASPEEDGGKEWVVGEAVPYAARVMPWAAFLVPLKMQITAISDDYPWWRLRWNRLGRDELSMAARLELRQAAERRELLAEKDDIDGDARAFLFSKGKRRVTVSGRGR